MTRSAPAQRNAALQAEIPRRDPRRQRARRVAFRVEQNQPPNLRNNSDIDLLAD
jgi:hypothetical protein